jgi:hypothetical protein
MKVIGEDILLDNLDYTNKNYDIDYIPLDNLSVIYIPLYYKSVDHLKTILQLGKNGSISDENYNALNSTISNINKSYKPYNSNIINLLLMPILLTWCFIFFLILRFLYIKLNVFYSYILLFIIMVLFIIGSLITLYINNL